MAGLYGADYIDLSDRKLYGNYLIEYDHYYDELSKFHTALGAAPNPEAWYDDWRASTNTWYLQLYGDPYFVALVQERWFEILPVIKEEIGRLAQWEAYLAAASGLEREVYMELESEDDYRRQSGDYSFSDEVDDFRSFLNERTEWMTKQFQKSDPDIEGAGVAAQYDLGLTLLDADGELAVPNDTDFPIDYVTDGGSDLVIVANTNVTMILNGNPLTYDQQSCIITPEYLREGVNVLIARTEDGKQQVLRFETPSAEPTFISVGRDTVASQPVQTIVYMEQPAIVLPAEAPDTSLLWGGAIAASVILLLGGGVSATLILRRKKA